MTGPFEPLSNDDRRRTMQAAFAGRSRKDVRVFAYGALMWRPCFVAAEARSATLQGHARRLSVWSALARGTPERPGLAFGLEPAEDASCTGVVYRIAPGAAAEGLEDLWAMEMHTGVYRPAWVDVETPVGSEQALTFVVRRSHPQYAGTLSRQDQARYIAAATGKYGRCRDYLSDAVGALRSIGAPDMELEELLRTVDTLGD